MNFLKSKNRIIKTLIYLTNNEDYPKDEVLFDIIFFIINTLAVIIGSMLLFLAHEYGWIAFLIIEWTWATDSMRHNR